MFLDRIGKPDRFWSKVDRRDPDECWEWTAYIGRQGYGKFQLRSPREVATAPRVAYQLTLGPIPIGKFLCHTCDNKRCCNPSHMFIGTPADNSWDMAKKLRSNRKICPRAVGAIRKLSADGVQQRDIARRFQISQSQVGHVVRRVHWRHVP